MKIFTSRPPAVTSRGLGVDLDETVAARFPYVPAHLPFNRLTDGTVHDW
jgi:mannonate dehydratase